MTDCRPVSAVSSVVSPVVSPVIGPTAGRIALLVAGALLAVSAAACSFGDDGDEAASESDGASSETAADPSGPFAVGRRDLTLVDTTRATPAVPDRMPAEPDRTIDVEVVYPAEGTAGPEPALTPDPAASTVDAPPADGSFPVVVFAHGVNGEGPFFEGYAARWARRGYVAVLPTFPLSRTGIAVPDDVVDQPGDISFVLDTLGDLAGDDPLAGHVDLDHVAVGGHSLGAATALGIGYDAERTDPRVDATIPVAGGPLPYPGEGYDWPATPMLLAHGVADTTAPVAASDAVFDMAAPPVWYLRTTTAGHSDLLLGGHGELLADAIDAFLDAELRGEPEALEAMGDEVAATGLGEWRVDARG